MLATLALAAALQIAPGAPVERISLRELREESLPLSNQVEVEGTVAYSDPHWNFFFLIDSGAGALVQDERPRVEFGQRVRVRGRVLPGHGGGFLGSEVSVEILGSEPLPDPRLVTLEDWSNETATSDARSANWVEVRGTIEQVALFDGATRLWVRDEAEQLFAASIPSELELDRAWEHVGRRVELRGALGLLLDRRNEVRGPLLFVQSWDLVRFRGEARPGGSPIHAIGEVTHNDGQRFFVDDGNRADVFKAMSVLEAPVNGYVEVLAEPVAGGADRALVIRRGTANLMVWPRQATIAELGGRELGRRYTVTGDIVERDAELGRLRLADGEHEVVIRVPLDPADDGPELDAVRSIEAIGVLLPETEAGTPILAVASREDLRVLSRRFTISPGKLMWVGFGLLGVAVVAVAFIRILRREVRSRTHQLLQLNAQLRASYEAVESGVVALDEEGKLLAINAVANELLSSELRPGDSLSEFLDAWRAVAQDPAPIVEMASGFRSDRPVSMCGEIRRRGDRHGFLRATLAPIQQDSACIGALWVIQDQTKVRTLQAELLHAQKMEAVGTLVGGIAHDFNNLLTTIMGNLELLRLHPESSIAAYMSNVDDATNASFSAGETIRKLLLFSSKTELQLEVCAPNDLIDQLRPLLRHGFDTTIEFAFDLAEDLPYVQVDSTQMEQVILNLCLNARDAMPSGGTITIRSARARLNGRAAVALHVHDTGNGMTEEVREKVFEPFFTTKPAGKGTGLGLSTSLGIVQQHGGEVRSSSVPGEWTDFSIVLPVAPEVVPPGARAKGADSIDHLRGDETILVVDDEWIVRTVTVNLLEDAGYNIIQAANGLDALAILEQRAQQVDLVLLDIIMPGMSGHDVLRRVRADFPGLPVVLCSGYAAEEPGASILPAPFVAKPFRVQRLLQTVRALLDQDVILTPIPATDPLSDSPLRTRADR